MGSREIIIALILISCNSFLKRRRPEVLGLLTAVITGIGIDMWLFLLHNLVTPELWYSKVVCFGIGLIGTGLGTAIYLQTNFAPIPVDRLTLIIQELTGKTIFFTVLHFPRIFDHSYAFQWTNWHRNNYDLLFRRTDTQLFHATY